MTLKQEWLEHPCTQTTRKRLDAAATQNLTHLMRAASVSTDPTVRAAWASLNQAQLALDVFAPEEDKDDE